MVHRCWHDLCWAITMLAVDGAGRYLGGVGRCSTSGSFEFRQNRNRTVELLFFEWKTGLWQTPVNLILRGEAHVKQWHNTARQLNLALVMQAFKFCWKNCLCLIFQTLPHTLSIKSEYHLIKKILVKKYTQMSPLSELLKACLFRSVW